MVVTYSQERHITATPAVTGDYPDYLGKAAVRQDVLMIPSTFFPVLTRSGGTEKITKENGSRYPLVSESNLENEARTSKEMHISTRDVTTIILRDPHFFLGLLTTLIH